MFFCMFCVGQAKDSNHLFRTCSEARSLWEAALRRHGVARLDHLYWFSQLATNLVGDNRMGFERNQPEKFVIRIWLIWKQRKDKVFNDQSTAMADKCHWIARQTTEIASAFTKPTKPGISSGSPVDMRVQWTKPPTGWIKLNVDESCDSSTGVAACGGVLRDDRGNQLGGFMFNIGRCSSAEAEESGVLHGLQAALNVGVRNLIVESDSKSTIDTMRGGYRAPNQPNNIITRCPGRAKSFNHITFRHAFREQNQVADMLAKQARSQPLGLTICGDAPYIMG